MPFNMSNIFFFFFRTNDLPCLGARIPFKVSPTLRPASPKGGPGAGGADSPGRPIRIRGCHASRCCALRPRRGFRVRRLGDGAAAARVAGAVGWARGGGRRGEGGRVSSVHSLKRSSVLVACTRCAVVCALAQRKNRIKKRWCVPDSRASRKGRLCTRSPALAGRLSGLGLWLCAGPVLVSLFCRAWRWQSGLVEGS